MESDVAYAESVPRHVDMALLLSGEALRCRRDDLRHRPAASAPLYAWYLRKVCFLHVLPNDGDIDVPVEGERGAPGSDAHHGTPPSGAAELHSPSLNPAAADHGNEEAMWGAAPPSAGSSGKEVSFRRACAQLRQGCSLSACAGGAAPSALDEDGTVGRVRPRSPQREKAQCGGSWPLPPSPPPSLGARPSAPRDIGFALLCEFLEAAEEVGGTALVRHLAATVCTIVLRGKAQALQDGHASAEQPTSLPPPITLAQLSNLFDEDLLDDELAAEAGNATRSFSIWVNYEWASASLARQVHLAEVVTQWVRALWQCRGEDPWVCLPRSPPSADFEHKTASASKLAPLSAAAASPISVRRMYAALERVFEGHAHTRTMLMELSMAQRTPHLTENALAKLLFLQGPPTSIMMARSEVHNRGTQPILRCITNGMLLYAQYYIAFRSLAVARQCVRVALQVAQEVQSNAVLALAHYTAHVISTHQGRPADAANSIAIALQLTLPCIDAPDAAGTEAQMASLAFSGAAQLLLFFPGAVGPALRSVLSSGHPAGSADDGAGADPAAAGTRRDGAAEAAADGAAASAAARHSGAVEVQSVGQSIRHALLRAEATLLQAPPVEGRWIGVVAALQRETLSLLGALYGMAVAPLRIEAASLRRLLAEVDADTAAASPVYSRHPSRTLLWEVLRHAAHHALALEEHHLPPAAGSDALACLHTALAAVRTHCGAVGVLAADESTFFTCVVRYCVGCRLHADGCIAAAYEVWTRLAAVLSRTAGMHDAAEAAQCSSSSSADTWFWPPDHLLLYAFAQRRRAQAALFLGYAAVPEAAQQALLSVAARYAFPFGVLTAQWMEALVHQQHGRFGASLTAARQLERAARRIGYPSLCEAARGVQVTAHLHDGSWSAAQRVLSGCRPTTPSQRVAVVLQRYAAHVEPLLCCTPVRARDAAGLTRSWLAMLLHERLVTRCPVDGQDGSTLGGLYVSTAVPALDRLCLYSALQRALGLLGECTDDVAARTAECLELLSARQHRRAPDIALSGSCEELCREAVEWAR